MANTAEGLEQAKPGEQVNSEAGFAAALAAKGVEPDKETASDTSVLAGLETVEPAVGRDPATGRFAPKETTAPAADTSQSTEDTSTGEQFTSDDPAVAEFLAKYNGNLEEAIKGAANAQSLIGRRDEEREQLAQQVAELRGLVEGLKAGARQPQAPAVVLSDEQVEEQAASLIGTHGYVAAATQAANASLSGDARVYDSILEQWLVEQPIQAQRFDLDFQMWKREQTTQQPTAPAADPWVEDQKATSAMKQSFAALGEKIGAEQFAALTAVGQDGESPLTRALSTMPQAVVELVTADDAATRLAGLELVYDRARAGGLLAAAPAQGGEGGMPESVRRKLAGAGVATAGLRPASGGNEGGNEPQSKEEAIAAFKSAIVAAETTSVASGLTYGPQGK